MIDLAVPPVLTADDGRGRQLATPCFSLAQAQQLAGQAATVFGYQASAAEAAYLAGLLQSIPYSAGSLAQVLAHGLDALHEKIVRDDSGEESGRELARMVLRLIDMATALVADPQLAPWFDGKAVAAELACLAGGAAKDYSDAERERLRFLQKVEAAPALRRRCMAPPPSAFLDLVTDFPNFAGPLHFLAEQAAIAALRAPLRFDVMPLLLTGPAGVGKTHFALALAKLFASSTEVLSMASQSCGFALAGMDRGWSTARAGLVFTTLLQGDTLAPVIVLDEIDKAHQDGRSDPLGPLYSLLEPRSAREFRDEFAGFAVDASEVLWLATANDCSRLPVPLLSRFKVFDIAPPSRAQALAIAGTLYQELSAGIAHAPAHLPASWAAQCVECSVREMRSRMQQALGCAALRALRDGSGIALCADDLPAPRPTAARRIGFV